MDDWQFKRHCLSHDWLQNSLLTSLDYWLSQWEKEYADSLFLHNEVHCEPQFVEARQMILSCSTCMSPALLFDEFPMNRNLLARIEWLRDIAHRMWGHSCHVDELQNQALGALQQAVAAYNTLTQARANGCLGKAHVQDFRDSIQALSSAVMNLPGEDTR